MSWNPLDWFTGIDSEAEQKRGEALDAQIRAMNQDRVKAGEMTVAQYDDFEARNAWTGNVSGEVNQAAWDGAAQAAATAYDRVTAPIVNAVDTGKKVITIMVVMQWALAGLALYLVYRFFVGGGSVKQVMG